MIGVFDYVRVSSVEERCALIAAHNGAAVALAGGTDLLVNIRNTGRSPDLLVDFKDVAKMNQLVTDETVGVKIGTCVPLNVIADNKVINEHYRALAEAARSVGSYQVRNRATLGGNIANASPAADTAPALLVLNASVSVAGKDGTRKIPIRELFTEVKKTSLRIGEVITDITLPPVGPRPRSAFIKKQRVKGHDLAIINVAGYYDPDTRLLRMAIGSCAVTPILLPEINLSGHEPIDGLVKRLNAIAQNAISPIDDIRASAEYRRGLVLVLLHDLLSMLLGAEGGADEAT